MDFLTVDDEADAAIVKPPSPFSPQLLLEDVVGLKFGEGEQLRRRLRAPLPLLLALFRSGNERLFGITTAGFLAEFGLFTSRTGMTPALLLLLLLLFLLLALGSTL